MSDLFRYVVSVDEEGRINTQPEVADEVNKLGRTASTFDIYQTSRELVSDVESLLLADRVARTVLAAIQPQNSAEELKNRLLSALSDRGIETPKA